MDEDRRARPRPWRIRPLYALLAALIGGILVAPLLPLPMPYLLGAMALLVVAALLLGRRPAGALPLLAAFVLFGILRAEQADYRTPDDISYAVSEAPAWVKGNVISGVASKPGRPGIGDFYTFTLRADTIVADHAAPRAASGLLRVTLFGSNQPPQRGDTLWLHGAIEEPPAATNPDGFDDRAFLARQGIHATLLVKRAATDLRFVSRVSPPLTANIAAALREHVAQAARANLSPQDADLLLGMLVAERGHLPADVEDAFARTGTLHLLSVSGIHVAVVAALLAGLMRLLTVPRKIACGICLAGVWLFALASGSGGAIAEGIRAPALRAALCTTIFLIAPLIRRRAEPPHSLAVAAFVLLLLDPFAVRDPGALLTFATVGTLLLWMPALERLLCPWEPGMTRAARFGRIIVLGMLGGIVAQIGAGPLSATYFHLFSLVSPLANLVLAPLADTLLGCGLLLSAAPGIAPLWNLLALGLHLLREIALAFAAPAWAAGSIAAPPPVFVLVYYALLMIGAILVRRRILVPKRLFLPGAPAPNMI